MSTQSEYATDKTILIDDHYRRMGWDVPWTNADVNRVCKLLRVTPHELGRIAQLEFTEVNRYLKADQWPKPVTLVLRLIRDSVMNSRVPVVPVDLLVE